MTKVKVITDSTADLPKEIAERYGITILPMTTSFSGVGYRDGVDLTAPEFYNRLASDVELPHTSQHSPQFLVDAYLEAMADSSKVIAIHLSSGLSGTTQNAYLAQEILGDQKSLVVVDSLSASLGQGLLAVRAAQLAQLDLDQDKIVADLIAMRGRLRCIFIVNTLKYLLKGGRINRLQATVGSLLDIKPILHFNSEGKIDQIDKIRGRKAALRQLISMVIEQGVGLTGQTVGVSHAVCPDDAEQIKGILLQQCGVKNVIIGEIGAVIGTHVGPGTVAVFFQGEPRSTL